MAMQSIRSSLSEVSASDRFEIAIELDFNFLSDEYERLFASSDATAFQCPQWLHAFFTTLVPALDVEPLIVTLRDDQTGALKMVLPLVRQTAMGAKLIQPADLGVSDYNALIAAPDTLADLEADTDLCDQIIDELKPFDAIFFRKQRADGFCMSQLFKKAVVSPNENAAYDIDIDTDFDTWFAKGVSKRFRKSVRSKQRRFESNVGPLTFDRAVTPQEIDEAFAFMRRTRQERFPDDLFCDDAYFAFYRDFAGRAAEKGRAFTHVCKADGRIAAVEFGLIHNGTSCLVHGAFDMEFGDYSPGNLSVVNLIKDLLESGLHKFDFTIGDHEYKTRFNARKTELYNAVLANGPIGQLVGVTYRNGGGIKRFLAKLNRNVN